MKLTIQVTPEMVGLSWRRVLRSGLTAITAAMLGGALISKFLQGRFMTGSIVGLGISMVLCALLMRPLARARLKITDEGIEQLDGPIICKDAITAVNEYTEKKYAGIEIVGKGKPKWLRDYRIFVPAAAPEYQQIKELIRSWTSPQDWHAA
jgi:hypothetical protein